MKTRIWSSVSEFCLLIGICAATFSTTILANWTYSEHVDSMTDEQRKQVTTRNELGHELTAYIGPEESLWLTFSLAGSDQFDHEKALMVRVDKHEPRDLSFLIELQNLMNGLKAEIATLSAESGDSPPEIARTEALYYEWKPKFINFSVGGVAGLKEELMTGDTLTIRYYLFAGGYKDVVFSLSGFSEGVKSLAPQ